MPVPVDAPLAPDLDLPDGYRVVFDAVSPTTGNPVASVQVSNVSIFGTLLGTGTGAGSTDPLGPFMLVPGPGA